MNTLAQEIVHCFGLPVVFAIHINSEIINNRHDTIRQNNVLLITLPLDKKILELEGIHPIPDIGIL